MQTRRDFLKLGLGALSGLAMLEIGGASLLFMQPRSLAGEFGGKVNAGDVASFLPGSVTPFPDGRFYLVRTDAETDGFLAIYSRCTHLGCAVDWQPEQGRFFCPCHASTFDVHGDVENPPAPRALDTFTVTITDGAVMVDTARVQQRDRYDPAQLTRVSLEQLS